MLTKAARGYMLTMDWQLPMLKRAQVEAQFPTTRTQPQSLRCFLRMICSGSLLGGRHTHGLLDSSLDKCCLHVI